MVWKMPSYSALDGDMYLVRSTANEDAYFHAIGLQMDWPIIPIMTTLFGKQLLRASITMCCGESGMTCDLAP